MDVPIVRLVQTKKEAQRVIDFLCSPNAFQIEMTPLRRRFLGKAVYGSMRRKKYQFWFVEDKEGAVIGAIGVYENERKNGGYWLDYFAVHGLRRREGIGSLLLHTVEDFVGSNHGRFLMIDTGDTEVFTAARRFYEKHGYRRVSFIPDYYDIGDSRIDYYKKISL